MVHRKQNRHTAFLWHRRAGLAAIILVIIIAITGIMLNHTEQFELDKTYADSALVLDWYGLEPEGEPLSYAVNGHSISQWQQQIFFDNKVITSSEQSLHGVIASDQFIVLAFDSELLLLSDQGGMVERIPVSFANTRRLGSKDNRPVIETSEQHYYRADARIIDWNPINNQGIAWSEPVALSNAQHEALLHAYRGNGLSLERVILDLHSGRIFGHYGIYIMDAAAIALLWLSLSGLWVWWRRQQKQKSKRHYRKHHRG
jgi:hypothetical protein